MRREAEAGTIRAAARRADDPVLLVQRLVQLADIKVPGWNDTTAADRRRIAMRPDGDAVDLLEALDQAIGQLSGARSMAGTADLRFGSRAPRRIP